MARIVSVTFETEAHARPGHFSIPKRVAEFLGIEDDDPIELSVLCEGLKVEIETKLRSGLEMYHRAGDPSTAGLEQIPALAPLVVTVWHPGDEAASSNPPRTWDRPSFVDALAESGMRRNDAEHVLDACLSWADSHALTARWGNANLGSVLIRLDDERIPSNVGHKQRFFALWTGGAIELQFHSMAPPFDTEDRREDLRKRLNAIDGVSVPRSTGYPSIPMRLLADPARRKQFLAVQEWLLAETRGWLDDRPAGDGRRSRWNQEELFEALGRYEQECIDAGMRPKAVHSYWDYANRFIKWRIGKYRPRDATAPARPVSAGPASTAELADEAKVYVQELEAAGLRQSAIDTYYRHAMFFIRWLDDDFEPGGRLKGR